jgi:RNA polymerase sigma factor (sigma-70 family)
MNSVVQHIRKLAGGPPDAGVSDQVLLGRFIEQQDEAAIAALVRRHGPMVRDLCWRLLRHDADAEDAFQAVFVVLVRQGRSIRKQQCLAGWLHGVAYRIAARAKRDAVRRRRSERRAATPLPADPAKDAAWRDLCEVLDAELCRLSETYRLPLVLCYLQGATRDDAAKQLACSLRTLDRRLHRGRELLRLRLARHGLTLSAALLAAGLAKPASAATLPTFLAASTIKAATQLTIGKLASAAGVSAKAAALTEEALRGSLIAQWKTLAAIVLAGGLIAGGAGAALHHALLANQPDEQPSAREPAPQAAAQPKRPQEPPARTDLYGDPLPAEAVARMGSGRLRHGDQCRLAFSPDGKYLASGGIGWLRIWDAATGKLTRRIDLDRSSVMAFIFSGEGVAVADYNIGRRTTSARVVDLASGKVSRTIELPPGLGFELFPQWNETCRMFRQHRVPLRGGHGTRNLAFPGRGQRDY